MNTGSRRARKIIRELRQSSREGELNVVSLIDIFAILVLYLLVNALVVQILPSPKALTLPESVAQQQPQETVLVMITNDDILVDNRKVMSTSEAIAATSNVLPQLKFKLNEQPLMQVHDGEAGDVTRGDVNIMADKAIPFHLLKKVMATCSDARFARISLAVVEKEGAVEL